MDAWLIAALVVAWILIGLMLFVLYVLIKTQGELRLYHRDLDHRLEVAATHAGAEYVRNPPKPPEQHGLPLGEKAPIFALPDLDGAVRSVEDYRGEPFVLTFFATGCGFCQELAPRLGELEEGHPLVLVSHGDPEETRRQSVEHGWQCDVIVEPEGQREVMKAYEAPGTPSGYLIDEDGLVASPLAVGSDAVLALRSAMAVPASEHVDGGSGNGLGAPLSTHPSQLEVATGAVRLKSRPVTESTIVRDGLRAGAEAPNFVLADLDGKPRSLIDYRGKRVLLVFSDVTCGPCQEVALELVSRYKRRPKGLEIVMIGRGDPETSRRRAKRYPFPVLLQKSWEVSKLYGMFATPIGYLIDENGIIVEDVAVGPQPILDLVF